LRKENAMCDIARPLVILGPATSLVSLVDINIQKTTRESQILEPSHNGADSRGRGKSPRQSQKFSLGW
jgi:hypothetical protein